MKNCHRSTEGLNGSSFFHSLHKWCNLNDQEFIFRFAFAETESKEEIEKAMKEEAERAELQRQANLYVQQQVYAEALKSRQTPAHSASLVGSRGLGMPEVLTARTAEDASALKTWRTKRANWVCAALPAATPVFELLEKARQGR